jgi:hypothetical protein
MSVPQPLAKLPPRHRVEDMRPLQLALSYLVDALAHEAQVIDAVCIGIHGELETKLARPMDAHIVSVEPLRLAIKLHRDIVLLRRLEHCFQVDLHRLTLMALPAWRVGEHVDGRVGDSLEDVLGHRRSCHIQVYVDGEQDDIAPFGFGMYPLYT